MSLALVATPLPVRQATRMDKAVALRNEARTYEHGEGVKKAPAKAVQLYCEAARLGDAEAQYSLGWMYANGRGMQRDDAMAAYFFQMAAKTGHPQAQRMLKQVGNPVSKPPECLFDSDGRDIVAQATPDKRKFMEMVLRLAPEYGVYPTACNGSHPCRVQFQSRRHFTKKCSRPDATNP